jgi:carbonic anhydrase
MPIFLNLLIFFLPIATADKAFRDYGLVNEILDTIDIYKKVGPSEDNILKVIYIRQELRDLPVFANILSIMWTISKAILGERIPSARP